ncbi:MAG: enoyl-CoA hydratase-related protein, partial [Alphaproteobacteria bacterium]
MDWTDVSYRVADATAWITIERPEVKNAFRPETVDELVLAFRAAWADRTVAVCVLSGANGTFCSGGDQSGRDEKGYGDRPGIGLDMAGLHGVIRGIPKPVIAMVDGYAIGGGNVLATICDLTIASDRAVFGQVGPRMGSVDPGFGTAYLARVVGEKKAREMWYLCRRYPAAEALAMGLVNKVVPADALRAEVESWCREIAAMSP